MATGGVIPEPVRFASNERPIDGLGLGVGPGVPVGVGVGLGPLNPANVPFRIAFPPFEIEIVDPAMTTGTVWPLSLRRRSRPSPPLCSDILPTAVPSTATLSDVPAGRLI